VQRLTNRFATSYLNASTKYSLCHHSNYVQPKYLLASSYQYQIISGSNMDTMYCLCTSQESVRNATSAHCAFRAPRQCGLG
jgi:hypothetical protein